MSETFPRLQLKNAYIELPIKPKTSDQARQIKDIQNIHNPSQTLGAKAAKLWARTIGLDGPDLASRPHDPRSFTAKFSRGVNNPNALALHFYEAHRPRQAAGWAALQLYKQLTVGPSEQLIFATDPRLGIEKLSLDDEIRATILSVNTQVSFGGPKAESGLHPEVMFTNEYDDGHDNPATGTTMSFANVYKKSLPDILQTVKQRYDELLITPAIDNSQLVAGMVGAQSLEGFKDAWDYAAGRETPLLAAQTLLQSEVFLDA